MSWKASMAIAPSEQPLNGRRILVCRPQPKADSLCHELGQAGAEARALPMIDIQPLAPDGKGRALLQDFDHFQHVIAVSPSAAQRLLQELEHWWPQWPVGIHWWGVGRGTAEVFRQAGLPGDWPQDGHDSEALLAQPAFHCESIHEQKVLLAKGEGGRELITQTLTERGARIETLTLYQRQCPHYPAATLSECFRDFDPDTLIVLSGETLKNLLQVVQNTDPDLTRRQLIVPVSRVADEAKAAGFTNVTVAGDLSSAGLISACSRQPGDKDARER